MLAPVLVGVSIFCFLLIRVLPGDPVLSIVPETATQEDIERTRARYGLDRPLVEQYGAYMAGVVRGDFGDSIRTNRPVVEQVAERLPRTLELVVLGFLLSLGAAIVLGLFAAWHAGRLGDHVSRVGALVANSLPEFLARSRPHPRLLRRSRRGAGADGAHLDPHRLRGHHRVADRRLPHHRQHQGAHLVAASSGPAGPHSRGHRRRADDAKCPAPRLCRS